MTVQRKKRVTSRGGAGRAWSSSTASATGLKGRSEPGKPVTPSLSPASAAPNLLEEAREPRPYRTRYPIPEDDFRRLKERAAKAKMARGAIAAAADTPQRREAAPGPAAAGMPDIAAVAPAAAPTAAGSFSGIPMTGWIPPDCTLAAGPSHILLAVNSSIAIYNKVGGAVVLQQTLTQWFASVVQGLTIFDPKALYDQHAGRWVLLTVAFRKNPNQSVFLLSVSATSNPLGQWHNYVLDATKDGTKATKNWADYPSLGVDSHALYLTANMFAFDGDFQYAKIRVVPKAGPYSGGAATFVDFVKMKNPDNSVAFTIQPCHTFGAPQVEYLVNSLFPNGSGLTVWQISTGPGKPTLQRATVKTSPYSLPPNADQQGGPPPLNTGDVRLLHAVFRGDSIWTVLTSVRNWGAGNRASIHWFQIRAAATTLVQEGTYGARDLHYSYPALWPDSNGNAILVFSHCGANEFGSIGFTGRHATDPLGMLQPSALLKSGVAHYQSLDSSGRNRWGDYNGAGADPSNGRVIWMYSEFASAPNVWATWVGSTFF
jgi:hypothetical protein